LSLLDKPSDAMASLHSLNNQYNGVTMNTTLTNQEASSVKKFQAEYQDLVMKMQEQAESEGTIFLLNMEPKKPADFIFICMEPSIGRWAKTIEEGKIKVDAGFRNFTSSIEDFILHFCVQQYLCKANQTYHFTDVSKGAMPIELANIARPDRYKRWHELLLREMDLVAEKDAKFFALGKAVADYLDESKFPHNFKRIIHYSPIARPARNKGIRGHEKDYEEFKGSVNLANLLDAANKVFDSEPVMEGFREATLRSIARKNILTESDQQLIYIYKLAFEGAQSTAGAAKHKA
jgi:hypothetical protein